MLLQLETPLESVTAYAQAARKAGGVVVLNAAPARVLPPELMGLVDILIVNEGELATVAQCQGSIAECLQKLDVATVVVTLGAHGCCARQQGAFHLQVSFAITPVDSTGAGDTFCGALCAALCQGRNTDEALRYASAAAALACTRLGAQSSIPEAAEVAELLSEQPDNNTSTRLDALRVLCGLN